MYPAMAKGISMRINGPLILRRSQKYAMTTVGNIQSRLTHGIEDILTGEYDGRNVRWDYGWWAILINVPEIRKRQPHQYAIERQGLCNQVRQ